MKKITEARLTLEDGSLLVIAGSGWVTETTTHAIAEKRQPKPEELVNCVQVSLVVQARQHFQQSKPSQVASRAELHEALGQMVEFYCHNFDSAGRYRHRPEGTSHVGMVGLVEKLGRKFGPWSR